MANLRNSSSLIRLLAALGAAASLSACGGAMESGMVPSGVGGGGSQSVNCDTKLMPAFKTYHAVLTQQCNACHVAGGSGAGAFADASISVAFNVFKLKTESKIYSYAIDPSHKAPFSGPDNVAPLEKPKQNWNTAMIAYNDCMSAGTNPGGGTGGGTNPPVPPGGNPVQIFTQEKVITLVAGAAGTTLTWQLGSEMVTVNPDLAGARLTALVEGNGGGSPYVVISNIQLTGATASSLYARNVGVQLNGTLVAAPTGATFANAERYVPKAATRNVAKSGGAMIVPITSLTDVKIALGFEKLEKSTLDGFPIDFDPPTHNQLVGTTAPDPKKVFNVRCNSCHNAANKQGGIDLTNYNSIYGRDVIPFDAEKSLIFNSIDAGRMPPAGALPPAEKDSVRFWIMDGAPR